MSVLILLLRGIILCGRGDIVLYFIYSSMQPSKSETKMPKKTIFNMQRTQNS